MFDFDYEALRAIGLTQYLINQLHALAEPPRPGSALMRIVEVQRDHLTVHDGHGERQARALPRLTAMLQAHADALAVGDWVVAETHAGEECWIATRLEPLTQLARRANDGRRQMLASNVDTALLLMGLDLDYNPRRLERYLALTQAAGLEAVAVLTKADVGDAVEQRMAELHARLPRRIPVLALNGQDASAREALAPWLGAGQTLVLLGSSGAGKSTLSNTLLMAEAQLTGGVRRGDGRGRHTTTARSLHCLPGGACIIDTPGLRTWRPDADETEVAASFDDIAALAGRCRFRDCRHRDEPGCAVRETVPADRLLNYHKLLREARRGQQTALERKAETAKWKAIGKAGRARGEEKRR
ncbi:ribosome small subunit-dependent GTPase A [Chitinimonas koreensis]|uniref:ribosome small subunit-dependent GTPase A n=1 Tax=Chitinimonas koreensis TaxID=356302 RepID=UPI0004272880|nr:ribosome small subunit-dependent GTPase A [Chitinimonas koreensis]QNM97653.1 ribosome small subunit-dependent GTPase A [Chitinimonas koreensis]